MNRIYLDHAATSPVHPAVIDEMMTVMQGTFGNPSSIHWFGREARSIVDHSRSIAAASIHADHNEIIFTSGGTEADNMAIIGAAMKNRERGNHIITTEIEHHAVLHTCQNLEKQGFEVTYLPVDETGRISVDAVKAVLREDTILVTIMFGNNEVGTIQPISEIGHLLKDHQALFHTDAVQAYGLQELHVGELGVDLLSVSGHKINGPKGVGFLYCRKDVDILPLAHGGEQERKRRAGTENVPGIAGLAKAIEIASSSMEEKRNRYAGFKEILKEKLAGSGISYEENGSLEHGLPHVLNLSFAGTDVESMLVNFDMSGIAVSSGSACTAGSIEPSHVLVAMFGGDSEKIRNSIRFSFGFGNTEEDIVRAADEAVKIIHRLTT
ncbi:cysteine desulfurase family protein [Rossellomorea marisflavi]|uniref:cysteine desulfurase family protein n=1 Tax=Rossellomorea marisflavi TaxID=189381 RepID=UPI00064FB601|nr:cysteine desulfurase family protein [Rossellomorea marisflavi]KML07262.1 cysteine desulfurase [Rossellomorea marisflavi]TYO73258.1 cysteine desulfurase [Rossellomorea marisflavi]